MDFILSKFAAVGDFCSPVSNSILHNIIGIPTWYQYLPGREEYPPGTTIGANGAPIKAAALVCDPTLGSITNIWLIVAAIVDILLRVAAIAAVVMVIYGGVQLIASQGNPQEANKARSTIANALIGLIIAIAASAIVSFLAGRFS
jgi:hypothetical protein